MNLVHTTHKIDCIVICSFVPPPILLVGDELLCISILLLEFSQKELLQSGLVNVQFLQTPESLLQVLYGGAFKPSCRRMQNSVLLSLAKMSCKL